MRAKLHVGPPSSKTGVPLLIIRRLEATDVRFSLSDEQKGTLRESGVSAAVVDKLATVNRDKQPVGAAR